MTLTVFRAEEQFHKLSVLIPVYNEQNTLADIIDRVLAVSIPLQLEIVAVDDGSTDGSWEQLLALASRHKEVVAIQHDKNRGKGSCHSNGDRPPHR